MNWLILRAGAAFVFGLGVALILPARPATAQDAKADPKAAPKEDPKTDPKSDPKSASPDLPVKEPAPKPPTFPGYVFVTDVFGEVVRADEKTVKLRITWYELAKANNNKNQNQNLATNNGNYANPFVPNRNRPKQPQMQWKERHQDYDLDYLPQSLVRVHDLPPKLDEKGKKVPHTLKELGELRAPLGVVGYAADKADVVPGTILEVFLLRDKTIPADKVTDADMRIKYALIWGKDPNPPKDITNPSSNPKKN
jgi:hypothetical protein